MNNIDKPKLDAKPPSKGGCLPFIIVLIIGIICDIYYGQLDDSSGGIIFLILVITIIAAFVIGCILEKLKTYTKKYKSEMCEYNEKLKEYNEKRKAYEKSLKNIEDDNIKKYNIPKEILYNPITVNYIKIYPQIDNITNDAIKMIVGVKENSLFLIHEDLINCLGGIEISINNIKSFLRQGDLYVETNISGGGGGGTSIKGAVVGEVIAGPAGAIIGSRKKNDPIKTENNVVDKRQTILEFEYNNNLTYMYFDSKAYDVFMNIIPSKEINFVNSKNIKKNELIDSDDIYNQIKKLSELKNEGILTEEEFNEKKKVLLGKIQ